MLLVRMIGTKQIQSIQLHQLAVFDKIVDLDWDAMFSEEFSSRVNSSYKLALLKEEVAFHYKRHYKVECLGKFTSRYIPERKDRINQANGTFKERIQHLTAVHFPVHGDKWCMVFNQYPFAKKHLLLCMRGEDGMIRTDLPCTISNVGIIDDLVALVRDNTLPGVRIGLNAEGAGMSIPFFHCHVVREELPIEKAIWRPNGYWPASFTWYNLEDASHIRALKERIELLHSLQTWDERVSYNLVILAEKKRAILLPRKRDGSHTLARATDNHIRRIGFMEMSGNFIHEDNTPMTEELISKILAEVSLHEEEIKRICGTIPQ